MKLNFRQGLVSSEVDGNGKPNYLVGNGTGITLRASNRPIVFTVASGQKDYTIEFYRDVLAWPISMFSGVTSCWLYIDVNRATAQKTYGITKLAPKYGTTVPSDPSDGQHWFDTANKVTKVYNSTSGSWLTVLRVLAGKYTTTTLETQQFGSQVGLTGTTVNSGTILTDGFGVAITDSRGQFMTSEDVILVNGSPSYAAKLESNVTVATASQPIAAFHVVKYNDDGKVAPADYDNVGSGIVGIATVGVNATEPVSIVLSGKVYNPLWNWGSANVTLWVGQNGELVAVDPFSLGTRVKQRVPVARTIDAQTIIFDQGLGGVGEKGDDGGAVNLHNASATVTGITRLSVNPDNAQIPIAVGINDPILTSPKVPIEHGHPATAITVSPFGTFNGQNVQQALEFLQLNKLSTAGGTVTGNVSSTVDATIDAHLTNLGQVKTLINGSLVSYKRYTLSSTPTTITAAFNGLTSSERTFTVNTVVVLEWKGSVYLWTGGIGAPVTATADTQFSLIGKLADGGVTTTIKTANAYTAYEGGPDHMVLVTTGQPQNVLSYGIGITSGEYSIAPVPLNTQQTYTPSEYNTASTRLAVPLQYLDTFRTEITMYDRQAGWKKLATATTYNGTDKFVSCYMMQFCDDGSRMLLIHSGATSSNFFQATVFDTTTMQPIMQVPLNGISANAKDAMRAAISPDGTKVAVIEPTTNTVGSYAFKMYNVSSGTVTTTWTGLNACDVGFTPNGASVVLISFQTTAAKAARDVRVFSATSVPATPPAPTYTLAGGQDIWLPMNWITINSEPHMILQGVNTTTYTYVLHKVNVSTGATTAYAIPSGVVYGGTTTKNGIMIMATINPNNGAATLTQIDPATFTASKTINLPETGAGKGLYGAVIL